MQSEVNIAHDPVGQVCSYAPIIIWGQARYSAEYMWDLSLRVDPEKFEYIILNIYTHGLQNQKARYQHIIMQIKGFNEIWWMHVTVIFLLKNMMNVYHSEFLWNMMNACLWYQTLKPFFWYMQLKVKIWFVSSRH